MSSLNIGLIFFVFISLSTVVIPKTAEDEVKDIDLSSDSVILKNFTTHDNTLAPRPQTSVSTSSSSSLPKSVTQYDCQNSNVDISSCSFGETCFALGGDCIVCDFNCSCIYGQILNVSCVPQKGVDCLGSKSFVRQMVCQYCYQTPSWEHNCSGTAECPAVSSPRKMFKSNCSVKSDVICMGNRSFPKRLPCNWTSGYQWSTALILSITLGGFGADRFYLGHWQEGIGKLFSFGGLGVWTIIDVILIAIHYLGPANESLYI